MNSIIQYLTDPWINPNENIPPIKFNEDMCKRTQALVKELFGGDEPKQEICPIKGKKLKTIRKGQVWTVKQRYTDVLGNELESPYPMFVLIQSKPHKLFDTKFVRAYYISSFIEMSSGQYDHDAIVTNESILGYPFLVELFNEFPMHVDLLDLCFGTIDINEYKTLPSEEEQEKIFGEAFPRYPDSVLDEFKCVELRNSTFLSNSAMAYCSIS